MSVTTRLERFRNCVARLDPAANPLQALNDNLYVEPPVRSLAHQLTSGLQLAPASTHLVVGGVGAGKSTQLLLASEQMSATHDTWAVFVDISLRHDLNKDLKSVLLVLAGLELAKLLKDVEVPDVKKARERFHRWAHGYGEYVPHDPRNDYIPLYDDPGDIPRETYEFRPGALSPVLPPLGSRITEQAESLKALMGALPAPVRHFVVLFDSLDRLSDIDKFRDVMVQDLRALQAAGIGVVIVGPSRVLYGVNRPIVDLFDQLHTQPALDITHDRQSNVFFADVLARRADEEILPPQHRSDLVRWSGGILRDLIGLARNAIEEAFLADADRVDVEHVERARDRFGRSMMLGLRKEELETLQRLRRNRTFVPTSDEDLALLESRRVIEYPGITTRYALHPTIVPLLATLGPK